MDPVQVSKTEVIHQLLPDPWTGLGLFLVLGAICYGLFRLRAIWREDIDDDARQRELLTQFRESEREGVLSAEEFRLIKSRLVRPAKPVTETERREPAGQPADSGKELTPSSPFPGDHREPGRETDSSR